jgi:hypothetical protein
MCNGACVDLQNDPNNCGTCGTLCTGTTTTCTAGTCSVPPVTLASGQSTPSAIALDSTYVYWVAIYGDTVNRVPKAGGGVTTLVAGENEPYGLALDATSVYYTTIGSSPQVKKVPLAGGTPTVLLTQLAYGIALNGSTLFVGSSDLEAIPTGGGPLTPLATGQNVSRAVTADSSNVYWITSGGVVASVPIAGGAVATLASGQDASLPFSGMAVDATNVYWTNSDAGIIASVPIAGGAVTTLASGQTNPTRIAVAGGYVYWTNETYPGGSVLKVPVGGGTPTAIATGENNPSGIAVDDTNVYWTTANGMVLTTTR